MDNIVECKVKFEKIFILYFIIGVVSILISYNISDFTFYSGGILENSYVQISGSYSGFSFIFLLLGVFLYSSGLSYIYLFTRFKEVYDARKK